MVNTQTHTLRQTHTTVKQLLLTAFTGYTIRVCNTREQFKRSLKRGLFKSAYSRRCVRSTLTKGEPYKWTYLLRVIMYAESKLKWYLLCVKITPNGAVARDGRLCHGQRILEVS